MEVEKIIVQLSPANVRFASICGPTRKGSLWHVKCFRYVDIHVEAELVDVEEVPVLASMLHPNAKVSLFLSSCSQRTIEGLAPLFPKVNAQLRLDDVHFRLHTIAVREIIKACSACSRVVLVHRSQPAYLRAAQAYMNVSDFDYLQGFPLLPSPAPHVTHLSLNMQSRYKYDLKPFLDFLPNLEFLHLEQADGLNPDCFPKLHRIDQVHLEMSVCTKQRDLEFLRAFNTLVASRQGRPLKAYWHQTQIETGIDAKCRAEVQRLFLQLQCVYPSQRMLTSPGSNATLRFVQKKSDEFVRVCDAAVALGWAYSQNADQLR